MRTPTGYRCQDCVRVHQRKFDTARWLDYPLVFLLATGLSYAGSLLVSRMGFFTIFLAPIAGMVIAEIIRAVIQKRRSKLLFQISAGATAFGGLIPILEFLLVMLISSFGEGSLAFRLLLPLLWQIVYAFTVTSTVYYRLHGIRL